MFIRSNNVSRGSQRKRFKKASNLLKKNVPEAPRNVPEQTNLSRSDCKKHSTQKVNSFWRRSSSSPAQHKSYGVQDDPEHLNRKLWEIKYQRGRWVAVIQLSEPALNALIYHCYGICPLSAVKVSKYAVTLGKC